MKEIAWKDPKATPVLARGHDIRVWAVIEFYQYNVTWGQADPATGKASRKGELARTFRTVVDIQFCNSSATDKEIEAFTDGEGYPSFMDEWTTEDGDFFGFNGFYSEDCDEGGMYRNQYTPNPKTGELCHNGDFLGNDMPSAKIIAWAEFERPELPDVIDF